MSSLNTKATAHSYIYDIYVRSGGGGPSVLSDWKEAVRLATTANHALNGLAAIDGVVPVAGNRILVKDQAAPADNGIYVAAAGAWSRADDANVSGEVTSGIAVEVNEGTANGQKIFILTTANPITLGATGLTFEPRGGREGASNTLQGQGALAAIAAGLRNTAIGRSAGAAVAAANDVTAVGFQAGLATTASLTAFGSNAAAGNTIGTGNTAVGINALLVATTAVSNTAVGSGALAATTVTPADNNTGVGFNALTANTTGASNTALGSGALDANTTGLQNTAVGTNALGANTTTPGDNNTAVGFAAGLLNTTGAGNTAVGASALDANLTGGANTAVGVNALGAMTASNGTAVGSGALVAATGAGNTAIGQASGAAVIGGSDNVCVGRAADTGAAQTGSTVLGAGAVGSVNNGLFFRGSTATAALASPGTIGMGTVVAMAYDTASGQAGPDASSRRFKSNISALEVDSSKIYDLREVSFTSKNGAPGNRHFGFIAEEVVEILPQIVPFDDVGPCAVAYDRLTVLLVSEVRKLRDRLAKLETKAA